MALSDADILSLREQAKANPLATADSYLQPDHVRYAENGWWVGLSVNA